MKKNLIKDASVSSKIVRLFLNIVHLDVSDKTFHLLLQIFKFGIVGVVATIIDFIFLYLFRDIVCFSLVVANTLAFSISVIYNYFASLTFVFDVDKSKGKKRNFVIFIVCSVIGLGLNDLIVFVVTDWLGIYYMISKVIATLFVMVFNFVTRKKFLE